MGDIKRRLDKLEVVWQAPPCPTCRGWGQIEVLCLEPGDVAPAPPPNVCPACGKRFAGVRQIRTWRPVDDVPPGEFPE